MTEVCMKAAQHAQFLVLNLLQQSKRALVSDKKYSDERVDVLSCVLLAERGQLGQPLILTIIYLPSPGRPRHHPEAACGEAGRVSLLRRQVRPQGGGAAAGGGQGTDQWPLPRCPLQVVSQLTGLDTLVTFRRRIQASCSTAFLCPLHPAHRDILAVILQGGSSSCCVAVLTVLTVLSSDVYATRKASSLLPVVLAAQSCANTLAAATHRAPAQLLHMLSAALAGAVETEVHNITFSVLSGVVHLTAV